MIQNPCISVCTLDKNGVCEGCYRTAAELLHWFDATEEEQKEILKKIEERKKTLKKSWWNFKWANQNK